MKIMKKTSGLTKLPLACLLAASVTVAGCSGDQLGDTNGGLSAGGASSGTLLGAVGAVVLAGALLASDDDDDNNSAIGGTDSGTTTGDGATTGTTTGGGTTGGGTTGGATTGTTTGGGTPGTTTGGGTTGTTTGGGTTGTTTGGGTTGTTTGGGTTGTTTGGGTTGTTTGGGTTGGTTDGGTTTGGTTGGNTGTVTLGQLGAFSTELLVDETVPVSSSTGAANAAINFDRTNGGAVGDVVVSGITVTDDTRVDIMVGPPGANGFVAVELERTGPNTWSVPAVLSDAQRDFVLQNINAGNLYVSVRADEFSDDLLRRQILPAGVSRYTTTVGGTTGGTAMGFLMVNTLTGEYAITWNTVGAEPLASAHVNDGVVSGPAENNLFSLSQRTSNPSQFFGYGNFMDVNDPLTDLLTRLESEEGLWLDAHAVSDDSRVFHGRLVPDPF